MLAFTSVDVPEPTCFAERPDASTLPNPSAMRLLSLLSVLHFAVALPAQYFQQDVAYTITVALDDERHTLRGDYELVYTNNSPDALREIYFHLWPNAFKNNETAFARQQVRQGRTRFYFAEPEQRGYIDSLAWTVDGEAVVTAPYRDLIDVTILKLNKVLPPGGTVTVRTPFRVQIPSSFSRLGHVGTSYQMTQWYPKPAVYDAEGWHPMPNLNQGEFYSEFGTFDVTLTLPVNYVVGATGVLQTESERAFLRERDAQTRRAIAAGLLTEEKVRDTFPASSPIDKTIRYTAEKVHDFAWFADKRFHVLTGDTTLASGKRIETYAMFSQVERHLWTEAVHYLNRAVRFYSDQVGEYPYPQATAVQSALSAGAGMEYPMITVIGRSGNAKDLDDVITHEVGHNWFYGILGSNERVYPWLDEGLNTFYEYRYMDRFYGGDSYRDVAEQIPPFLAKKTDLNLNQAGLLYNARARHLQSSSIDSDSMSMINYGVGSYTKPAQVLFLLENYLGKTVFDEAMRAYYATWKFKHPQPADLQAILEAASGKTLDWAFDDLLAGEGLTDYAIRKRTPTDDGVLVTVENKGDVASPFPLAYLLDGEVVNEVWVDGFRGTREVKLPRMDYDAIVIDPDYETLEIYRRNDNIKSSGGQGDPLRLVALAGLEHTRERHLYVVPILGGNSWDGFAAGIGLHNYSLLEKPVEFALLPQYAFGTEEVVGLANLSLHTYPGGAFRKITYALDARSYHYFVNERLGFDERFVRLRPSITVELPRSPAATRASSFGLEALYLQEDDSRFDTTGTFAGLDQTDRFALRGRYILADRRGVNPYSLEARVEYQRYDDVLFGEQSYTRLDLTYRTAYTYDRGRSVDFRFFGGYFLQNTLRDRNRLNGSGFNISGQAYSDFNYDDFYLARNDARLFTGRQVVDREGGFKVPVGSAFAATDGNSNNLLLAVNVSADLPRDLPFRLSIRPYFDLAFADKRHGFEVPTFSDQLWWNGGLTLRLVPGVAAVHFPLVQSKNIRALYDGAGRGSVFERMSFTLDLQALQPGRLRGLLPR